MTIIELFANDQNLIIAEKPKIASGNENSIEIHVEFNSEWDEYSKTAVFFNDKSLIYEQLMENGKCVVPHEVLKKAQLLYIGIRGVNSSVTKVKTSALIEYHIVEGAPEGTATTIPPTADIYQQLLTAYNNALKAIEKYKTDLSEENEFFKKDVVDTMDEQFDIHKKEVDSKMSEYQNKIDSEITEIKKSNKEFENNITSSVDDFKTSINNSFENFKNDSNQSYEELQTQVNQQIINYTNNIQGQINTLTEKYERTTNIASQELEPTDQKVDDLWLKITEIIVDAE